MIFQIGVDWGLGSEDINYCQARWRVPSVAQVAGELLINLVNAGLTSYDKIVIVGHSVGGQGAGLIGKVLNGRASAVISLDPARAAFDPKNASQVVQPTDA